MQLSFPARRLHGIVRRAFAVFLLPLLATIAGAQTPWQTRDIGPVGIPGTSSESAGGVEITGSGADIWETADQFHFRFQSLSGDGEIVARVTSLTNTHPWAKVGLMVRETLTSSSRHAMICVTPGNGTAFQHRATTGGSSASSASAWSAVPVWLKLVRSGNTLSGFTSVDGTAWTPAGSATLAGLGATVHAGIAITSHDNTVRSSARVEGITLSGAGGNGTSDTEGAPVISPQGSQSVASGSLFKYRIAASNSPTSYSATGLPAGLTLNAATGEITGVCGFNAGTYHATLRATNAAGTGSASQTFVVSGSGAIEMPYIREVSPPADGTYRVGDVLLFRVRFANGYSYPFVTGRPRIALTIGSATRYAQYAWGNGEEYHTYAYTVAAGDAGVSGISISDTIDLNGGTLMDSWPLWCALNMQAISAPGIRFEASSGAPAVPPVLSTPDGANGTYQRDLLLQIVATHAPTSYGMTVGPVPARPLGLTFDPATGVISGKPQASGTYTLTLQATNAAGTGSKTLTLRVPHIVARVTMPTAGTYRAGDSLAFQVAFSNPVRVTGSPTLSFLSGDRYRAAAYAFGSGQQHTFTYVVQPGDVTTGGTISLAPALALNGGTVRDAETNEDFGLVLPKTTAEGIVLDAPAAPPSSETGTDGWTSKDIGAVAIGGSSSESGGTVTIRGSGADIWDSSDEFHFRYKALTGDGEFVARITSLTDTHPWAKAGLMLRESDAPGSAHVWICVSSANGTAVQFRDGSYATTQTTTPSATTRFPTWLRIVRRGADFTFHTSDDGANWTLVTTLTGSTLPSTLHAGFAVTSHNDGVLCTATFDNVRFGASAPPTEPATWSFADIGAPGLAGSNSSAGNTITINGAGHDIWDKSDGFRFVYRSLAGDGVVEAQVSSLTNTHAWAKAGVMLRESLAPDARNVFVFATPNNGLGAQMRAAPGGLTQFTPGPWVSAPYWVRLVRSGNRVTAFASPNGSAWTEIAAFDVAMTSVVYAGFAVTSHDPTKLNTAVFTDPFVE